MNPGLPITAARARWPGHACQLLSRMKPLPPANMPLPALWGRASAQARQSGAPGHDAGGLRSLYSATRS